jgi:hypothetical protein
MQLQKVRELVDMFLYRKSKTSAQVCLMLAGHWMSVCVCVFLYKWIISIIRFGSDCSF